MIRRIAMLLVAFLCVACAPRVRTTMIGQPTAPNPDQSEILVFSARIPECPFEEIALISARMGEFEKPGLGMDGLLAALKDRARELGGHAVVGLTDHPRTKAEGPSLSGTAVRFTSSECQLTGNPAGDRRTYR